MDYADPASWFALGASEGMAIPPGTDLFYVHPTTLLSEDWNQRPDDALTDDWTRRSVIARQMSVFAPVCRTFAPRYGQASSRAYREPGTASDAAYDTAFADVRAAFRHYLRHENGGRPVILFGHSQGALHVGRLLDTIIEPEGLHPALVAAYAVGIAFSEGFFGTRYRHIQPCVSPGQTGCLISWNSFLAGSDTTSFLRRSAQRDSHRLGGAAPGLPICINPLSFDRARPDMPASANPGTLVGTPGDMPVPPCRPGLVGARSSGGVLFVSPVPDPAHGLLPLPGGNMHMHDIALFFESLRQDAHARCAAHVS